MSSIKPIKLYGHSGPNPIKVLIILEELGIPYEVEEVPFAEVKGDYYTAINPNGRLPAIDDPNTGLRLWESGAIVEYLMEKYDTERKLSFEPGSEEYWHARQYMAFQISGQGPYFGNAIFFTKYAQPPNKEATERFVKEIHRVHGVVERILGDEKKKNSSGDGPWLVGNKMSYADLSFSVWSGMIALMWPKEQHDIDQYPLTKEWLGKMTQRKAWVDIKAKHWPSN
ncbi:glutathione S-transferase [Xylariaceae sp. FL1272]|nr:glutathione S-transferase [Xylariaceae sp. FL1272]